MINVRNISRTLKTRYPGAYEELVPNIGNKDASEDYPFNFGFELFSAGLIVGYLNDEEEIIEKSTEVYNENSEGRNNISFHSIVSFQQVFENNKDHAYTIELVYHVIALEVSSNREDTNEVAPEDIWNIVVSYADKGVGIIRQEWKRDSDIDIGDRIDELEDFWEEKVGNITGELTQIPQRDDSGRLKSGS